jgi:hypothetical protein
MRLFTPEEDQFIQDNYLTIPIKQIARMMGRAEGSVMGRFKRIGLSLPIEIAAARIVASRFQKGSIAHNKGNGMSDELREKVKHTWFSKGFLPHNTKEDGVIVERIDKTKKPYLYIRVRKAKWELLHREVWRKHKGAIPKGKIVSFKQYTEL